MKKTIKNKNNKGLTLIELLVAILLFGIVITLASSMLVQSFNLIEPSMRRMSASQLAELSKREIVTILRTAVSFESNDGSYEFRAYEPGQESFSEFTDFKLIWDEDTLRLEWNDSERIIGRNVIHFDIIPNENSYRYSFEIEITARDNEGNEARKSTKIRSRNDRE